MKLREHSSLNYHGSWPPVWNLLKHLMASNTLKGEIGTLKFSQSSPNVKQCYVVIEHQNARYISWVFCNDPKFCSRLGSVLAHSQNKTIAEIGDMEMT